MTTATRSKAYPGAPLQTMIPRSSFRNICLRLDSRSYEFLKTIRNGREIFVQPRSAIAIMHDFVYVPDNAPNNEGKVLQQVLDNIASTWAPLNLELTHPFRAQPRVRSSRDRVVSYDIQSLPLIKHREELSFRLKALSLSYGGQIKPLGEIIQRIFRPSIPIQQKLQEHAAGKLMDELTRKYGDTPGNLKVDGLSLGPQRTPMSEKKILADTDEMDDELWKHYTFTGSE